MPGHMKRKFEIIGFFFAACLLVVACNKDQPFENPFDDPNNQPPVDTTTAEALDPASIEGLHHNIFRPTCANSGCHDGTFEPDFRTPESSYATMVYHPVIKNDPSGTYNYRVMPGNADLSVLINRLTVDIDGLSGIMPLALEPDSDWESKKAEYIQNVRDWINNGALDMSGNPPVIGNQLPQINGVIAYADGAATILERKPGKGAILVPPGTSSLEIWVSLTDADIATTDFTHNKIRFSNKINDFEASTEEDLTMLMTPLAEEGYFTDVVDYYHKYTLDVSGYGPGTQIFLRVYVQDNGEEIIEIPSYGSANYIKDYASFEME